jgi:hypothetical protein
MDGRYKHVEDAIAYSSTVDNEKSSILGVEGDTALAIVN